MRLLMRPVALPALSIQQYATGTAYSGRYIFTLKNTYPRRTPAFLLHLNAPNNEARLGSRQKGRTPPPQAYVLHRSGRRPWKGLRRPLAGHKRRGFVQSRPGACATPLYTFARRAEDYFQSSTIPQFVSSTVPQFVNFHGFFEFSKFANKKTVEVWSESAEGVGRT